MCSVDDVLADLRDARTELEAALSGVPASDLDRPGALGDWSVRDILVHLAGWDRASRQALARVISEDDPVFERYQGTEWDWREWNERFLAERPGVTAGQALSELKSDREALLALISPLSDRQLQRRARLPWDFNLSVAEVLAVQVDHDREHAAHIRSASADWRRHDRRGSPCADGSAAADSARRHAGPGRPFRP